eukprot:g6675.t1
MSTISFANLKEQQTQRQYAAKDNATKTELARIKAKLTQYKLKLAELARANDCACNAVRQELQGAYL